MPPNPKPLTPIEATKHADTRLNIPTEEMRDLVDEQEKAPQTLLYPRDPSLDPQLVWRGKDEQDREALAVPTVPIYIQEKIHPQALIEDLRSESQKTRPPVDQPSLFSDFNGLAPLESIDFYRHPQHWTNRMILGDSLLVMASLAEKEGLKGKVQMIYMDPPYGIKFGSNWQVSTRKRDVKDGNAADVNREPEVVRAFRDTWKLGIHSYLSYLRDRLVLARELLSESGSIFVQIGDENVHRVRAAMDEVFGDMNQVATICFQKTGSTDQALLPQTVDYLLWFAKSIDSVKYRQLYQDRTAGTLSLDRYDLLLTPDGGLKRPNVDELSSAHDVGNRAQLTALTSARPVGEGDLRHVSFEGMQFSPGSGTFKTDARGFRRLTKAGRVRSTGRTLRYLRLVGDFPSIPLNDRWDSVQLGTALTYVVQTSTKVIERCVLMTTDPGDLVLDPTCGSGTTAYVAEQWGRRWITTDTSRVSLALARTRLMSGRFPYYLLADSPEGVRREAELTAFVPPAYKTENDIRKGFVYKRVPHITLKAIANNEEIDVIHERWQPRLDDLRAQLNAVAGTSWQEWEVPLEAPVIGNRQSTIDNLLTEWWEVRRQRQAEIDASIARRADVELLYDQPYEDNKRVRVTGPFTVESLSPHRMISVEDKVSAAEQGMDTDGGRVAIRVVGADDFGLMIIDHLKSNGVQNGIKNERLKFERLEPYPGEWIHAAGEYLEDGATKRVAVCIGPEFGTVGPELVKEAAKEAVRGVGFDLLLICGFAFDPHVSEEAKRYGALTVLPTKMNPDLAMGDELLKKTGAGNLFMVFGEPDIAIEPTSDGELVVEIRGLDVYDPTTGEIRGGIAVDADTGKVTDSRDDIAAWFIDTNYNSESFFVRHAYFTGADKPYERLQRTLRAEIDEAAWGSIYSTRSRPFPRPTTGKIAVKVINHYGDEVLKVYEA